MSDASDPLDFGVDLSSVRARIEGMGYFLSVQDIQAATEALDGDAPSLPPAAFVMVASEAAETNKIVGGHSQRVSVVLSILFAEPATRIVENTSDQMERTRKALIRVLMAWTPDGAQRPLQYLRYLLRAEGDGLVWGEVQFATSYRLDG